VSFARYLTAVLFAIDRRSPAVRFAIVITLFLGVFVADFLTDWDLSLRGLYFAPVALAAWTIGLRTGCVLGALAAMASLGCDLRASAPVRNATFMATDTTIHFAVYVAAALIVSHLRGALGLVEREKAQILVAARKDTTERRAAEQARYEAERQLARTEEQLRQSQKMEAIGRLAGGVAHDFNNLLSVILSYGAMLEDQAIAEGKPGDEAHEVRKAAERAAELTKQLLLFSRQRVIETRVLDLNALLARIERMLRRVLGEDIELSFLLSPGPAFVRAADTHLEQAIMNLVVNARDAMPEGGTLTIETRAVDLDREAADALVELKPGPHVMLAVSDTGHGMDQATQARVFEPFFTTKEVGKGTGLGLSTVFGIVQQSEGSILVCSEPGRGTTFEIYLPRITAHADVTSLESTPQRDCGRGHETIVLVEDAPRVRNVAKRILQRSGYVVYEMSDPEAALSFFQTHAGPIDLLLTDVVMPRMSGPELMKRVAALRPRTRVLFMSGYTNDAFAHQGSLERGIPFLQKPFTPASLSSKVREVLDAF
jgi:signal transduction histidine kinase